MSRLLITGASGFLGWNLCQQLKHQFEIIGTCHQHPMRMHGIFTVPINLAQLGDLQHFFEDIRPDAVIHTAAYSQPNFCETHRNETDPLNVMVPGRLADLCAHRKIPLVFTSSDMVFDGNHPPYDEESTVNPINYYGTQKALAEQKVMAHYPEAVICRMPLMFGNPGPFASSFIQPFLQALKAGKPLDLFMDEYRNPISARDAVSGILLAMKSWHGILHLGGKEHLSRYEFVKKMARIFQFPEAILNPCRIQDVVMPAPRPGDLKMNSNKAYKLGFNPGSVENELEALYQQL
ncbi:MAG: NAD(P)-dependent oxidoreductase [SAR324 cluster bacterium]|nr:NAD(P)-dependent oxidoreductase [SAR324 cluster bacterium]